MRKDDVARDAQRTLSKHGRSFRFAQVFLDAEARADAAIAYAFCRHVDDLVDETSDVASARFALAELESDLGSGRRSLPIIAAYRDLSARRAFGLAPAFDLIRGAESDLDVVRVETDADLLTYCYRVAGTVGLMMSGILGVSDSRAARHAVDLGIAMQLTNICRDVREDASRGRVYLPAPELAREGLAAEDLLVAGRLDARPELRQALARVVLRLLDRADRFYASGEAGLRYLPLRARFGIAVASRIYAGIGRRLRRLRGADPWFGRERVPFLEKCWLTLGAFALFVRASCAPRSLELRTSRVP